MGRRALAALLAIAGTTSSARAEDCSRRPTRLPDDPAAMRAVVVLTGEDDPEIARAIARLGANTLVTQRPPDPAAAAAAAQAGLRYMARISVRDVLRLLTDPELVAAIRSIPNLYGFEYLDEGVLEGYATPETQRLAYGVLKSLFPAAVALYATRLDPIATDPTYLDLYFRPGFTDLVTPYFYPVGTTVLGSQSEADPWEERLRSLLGPIAARMPATQGVLPVLQGFEQAGFPVGGDFPLRQLDVYREFWPDDPNLATFWWGGGGVEPLSGLSEHPALFDGFARIFGAAPSRPRPCALSPRPAVSRASMDAR